MDFVKVWLVGLVAWLLMSSSGYLLLRLSGQNADLDRTAYVVGMSMLTPIPVVWAWDLAKILSGRYGLEVMAVSHALFQVWEITLGAVGFRRVLGARIWLSIVVATATNLVFVAMGAFLSR
jgi:hypothetical protein